MKYLKIELHIATRKTRRQVEQDLRKLFANTEYRVAVVTSDFIEQPTNRQKHEVFDNEVTRYLLELQAQITGQDMRI